jgi:hypothetical protein
MAAIEIPGYRSTVGPDGRKIIQIPVSTTDNGEVASPPSPPDGTRYIGREFVVRPDGGRDYIFTYESNGDTPADGNVQISGQAAQEPIETHPNFNGEGPSGGTVQDDDLAAIKNALTSGQRPNFTGGGGNLVAAQELYELMLRGVTHYFTPSGITYSETFDETGKPSLQELCSIDRPPTDAPSLRSNSNWLLIGLRAQKIYAPESGNSFWRVTREWLASGPRGWNADYDIYA